MSMRANEDIRQCVYKAGIKLWEVAYALGELVAQQSHGAERSVIP